MVLGAGQLVANQPLGKGGRFPARQFMADLRTLAAVMRYLVEPDGTTPPPVAVASKNAGVHALRVTSWPVATLVISSNQMEMPGPLPNRPARS